MDRSKPWYVHNIKLHVVVVCREKAIVPQLSSNCHHFMEPEGLSALDHVRHLITDLPSP
jgi:hypothetical protein